MGERSGFNDEHASSQETKPPGFGAVGIAAAKRSALAVFP
jgi:hypothetical protein